MKIESRKIADLKHAYAVSVIKTEQGLLGVAASSVPEKCICFQIEAPEKVERVWDNAGGTMSLSQLNERGDFLATRNFFKGFDCKTAYVVKETRGADGWESSEFLKLPFLHRFQVIRIQDRKFLLGATICKDKDFKDDWSQPGAIYLGEIHEDQSQPFSWKPIIEGLKKNHGFYMGEHHNNRVVLIGYEEGLIEITIPEDPDAEWTWETLIKSEVSDACLVDLDEDGEKEIVTIEGFHGNSMYIYKLINGKYERVYHFPVACGHAFWDGSLLGETGFFMSYREANGALIWFSKKNSRDFSMNKTYIDENVGPANFEVISEEDKCTIIAACGASHEVKMYTITRG